MIENVDHVTIVVRDVDETKKFFALLGFVDGMSDVISGPKFSNYMGVENIEAEHQTLVLADASPRFEIQLLKYRRPDALPNPSIATLRELGFNHICFRVDDLDAEVAKLEANGVKRRNEVMQFHGRKLVYLVGPEDITVELSEWI